MKSARQRLLWLLPTLICTLALLQSAALLAQEAEPSGQVSPDQLTIAGSTGSSHSRRLLLRLPPGITVQTVVPGDLTASDGSAVLPAEAMTASWPTPEAVDEQAIETSTTDAEAVVAAGLDSANAAGGEPAVDVPVPLTVDLDLGDVRPGLYTGQIFVVTTTGELPINVNVSVKARGFWPFLVLLIGLVLSVAMSAYRRRGRQRDQLLVEVGSLTESVDADPELAADGIGKLFRRRIESELLDVHVALRAADWQTAGTELSAVRILYVTWRKDRANWIAQLTTAESMRARFSSRENAFFRELLARLDASVTAAPTQADAGPLRGELVTLARHEAEYGEADRLLVQMKRLVDQLPANDEAQRAVRDQYAGQPAVYARQLANLHPIADAEYAAAYRVLVEGVEGDILAINAALARGASARGAGAPAAMSAAGADLRAEADRVVPPLDQPIDREDAEEAAKRLRWFGWASYGVGLTLLALAGYNELYASKITFGANPWADYAALFAWGFGSEASLSAITGLVKNWEVPFGGE